jgi:Macrocin-O-methyltransferase (TylF)
MGKIPDLSKETNSSQDQLQARTTLEALYKNTPLPADQLTCNFGLYMRASVLVKYLVINDLYTRIIDLPGAILEFGCWWGQNLVLFENLRAIYEPFNKGRKVIGFDTFTGYTGFTEKDRVGEIFSEGNYAVAADHKEYLAHLLSVHEACNVLGHLRNRHALVQGDVTNTVPAYFAKHPETVVALAYFDMGLYQPTLACLQAIKPHLISGSVILLDEFNWSESPGEAIAFKEVFGTAGYKIQKSRFTPERAIVTIA